MTIIPCQQNESLRQQIEEFAEILKTQAHTLGDHGLDEKDFYNSGLFRGAIERIRGQFSATMGAKREFVKHILNYMEDEGFIGNWRSTGDSNRHDYSITLNSGRTAVIELKGCLDGNNTLMFDRPPQAHEFILWSICTNIGGNPKHNAWSGIHTRLSADIIDKNYQVDGLIIWDMVCATTGRPCPKVFGQPERLTEVGPFQVPPACLYVFPSTVPSPRNNPHPPPQQLQSVEILTAFHQCFKGVDNEINYVDFEVHYQGVDVVRTTRVTRGGLLVRESKPTPIQRS